MTVKLGSLFDGSGGFPLAGELCGITPVWASEIEPYPIAVTRSRFPKMRHLGNISTVNGAAIEPVDIITFGSPCQDLSVAGKRAGLKHEANGDEETTRSGLFMEAVRIIKEMRGATDGVYPRFAIWENVPGAFSSNKGEDFRVVLEELIKIVEPACKVPPAPKNRWPFADAYLGPGWSLAYRTLDAQYWGVPQRRRRIYLVADFTGECAADVLFECEGLRRHFTEGRTPGQSIAGNAETCAGATDRETDRVIPYTLKIRSGCAGGGKGALIQNNKAATLSTLNDQYLFQPVVWDARGNGNGKKASTITGDHEGRVTDYTNIVCSCALEAVGSKRQYLFENHSQDSRYRGPLDVCPMLPAQLGTGGNNQPFVVEIPHVLCMTHGQANAEILENISPCLNCNHEQPIVSISYIVRRLTPTECARLQGFPDLWGHPDHKDNLADSEYQFWIDVRNTHAEINGKTAKMYSKAQMLTWYNKLHTDSAEYKMWGNGIALPTALYVMQGVADVIGDGGNIDG